MNAKIMRLDVLVVINDILKFYCIWARFCYLKIYSYPLFSNGIFQIILLDF